MPSSKPLVNKRLSNYAGWALKDISVTCWEAQGDWDMLFKQAQRRNDPAMMAPLARLRDALGKIERKANDALSGVYRE
jgi:hypothetical protein